MPLIELATVLPGAVPFNEGNVNETYLGQVLLADGEVRPAVLKDLDVRQLANELLGAVLANVSNLPIPPCYLGLVRDGVVPLSQAPSLSGGGHLVFVSLDVKVPNITYHARTVGSAGVPRLIEQILGWRDVGRLYGFDAWIANVDRHPGNLLFGGADEVWLIDHGHGFSGPAWAPNDLDAKADYPHRLLEWLTPGMSVDQKRHNLTEATRFSASLSATQVAEAIRDSRIEALLPASDLDALRHFLSDRVSEVPRTASKALGMPTLV